MVGRGGLGKSVLDNKEDQIKDLLDKTVTRAKIARIFGVSWPTIENFIRARGLG